MKNNLTVMALPATENKADNPYNYILYSGLQKLNVKVKGYSLKRLLNPAGYDVLHYHWPENFVGAASKRAAYQGFAVFCLKLLYAKLWGKKIVWTVHNLAPHENRHPKLMKRFYAFLYKRVDGFISLTGAGAKEVAKNNVPSRKITVVPHPHYLTYYANDTTKEAARKKLNIPADKFVFLFIGQVRAYKNVTGLVKAFRQLNDPSALLVIAGKVHADVSTALKALTAGQANIKTFPAFINDDDLQHYLGCADLVVTPFTKVLNSGSVFLNLSFGRPALVPATESLQELQSEVGGEWVKTFSGELTAEHLKICREEMKQTAPAAKPDLSKFEWEAIAQQTKTVYQSLFGGAQSASAGSDNKALLLKPQPVA